MEVQPLCDRMAQLMAKAMDEGDRAFAHQLGGYITQLTPSDMLSAHFWFQYALAARLMGLDYGPMLSSARKAQGYSDTMEGDFVRDRILDSLRRGIVSDELEEDLRWVRNVHQFDDNRQAVGYMVEARIYYVRGDYQTAENLHATADAMWQDLGNKANTQWRLSNRFHWFKAATRTRGRNAYRLGSHILVDDPNENRKRFVRQMDTWGPLGLAVSDAVQQFLWKHPQLIGR